VREVVVVQVGPGPRRGALEPRGVLADPALLHEVDDLRLATPGSAGVVVVDKRVTGGEVGVRVPEQHLARDRVDDVLEGALGRLDVRRPARPQTLRGQEPDSLGVVVVGPGRGAGTGRADRGPLQGAADVPGGWRARDGGGV